MEPRHAVDHALLNRDAPDASWGNLGWWEKAGTYAQAAEDLARVLGNAAQLRPGDHVLDVGCGCGDQLLLWRSAFGVAQVVGRDIIKSQVELANRHIRHALLQDHLRCVVGSAEDLADMPAGSVDKVLSLDSAYHFHPRRNFLHEAWRVLKPGGRLALTDVAVQNAPTTAVGRRALAALAEACAIPAGNIMDLAAHRQELTSCGFTGVRVECCEAQVFPGFAAFARRHRQQHLRGIPDGAWTKLMVTGWACGAVWHRRLLHYAVITAQKE